MDGCMDKVLYQDSGRAKENVNAKEHDKDGSWLT